MNVENLNKLISHLEAQPPERINMGRGLVRNWECGTCGCIGGHAELIWPEIAEYMWEDVDGGLAHKLGLGEQTCLDITHPDEYWRDENGSRKYPAYRVIATLTRLRDTYLSTGQVVVDWGPEPDAGKPWVAPHVSEVIAPTLPAEITSLLRPSLAKTEA